MAVEQAETPWDDYLSDFTLVLDSGERLKCHKLVLANASPVLKTMLMTEMKEAKTNEMNMRGFTLETVTGFLRYIYADAASVSWKYLFRNENNEITWRFEKDFSIKDFGEPSPQLMRLAHMYEMKDLVMICADSLKLSKPDENTPWTAKDVQKLAFDLGNEGLKQCSNVWLASNAYETLSCGDRMCYEKYFQKLMEYGENKKKYPEENLERPERETTKPRVQLRCKHCNEITDVSGDAPNVLSEGGDAYMDDTPDDDSKVYIELPMECHSTEVIGKTGQ